MKLKWIVPLIALLALMVTGYFSIEGVKAEQKSAECQNRLENELTESQNNRIDAIQYSVLKLQYDLADNSVLKRVRNSSEITSHNLTKEILRLIDEDEKSELKIKKFDTLCDGYIESKFSISVMTILFGTVAGVIGFLAGIGFEPFLTRSRKKRK